MKHKDYLNWLKENDPMTYYEITSNPTGTDSDYSNGILFIGVIVSIIFFIAYLIIP